MRRPLVACGALCVLLPVAVLANGNPDPVRYVAANCTNCHGTAGRGSGAIPGLAGLQKAYFLERMRSFRDGTRTATVMQQIAKGYSDRQLEHLADYFAREPAK